MFLRTMVEAHAQRRSCLPSFPANTQPFFLRNKGATLTHVVFRYPASRNWFPPFEIPSEFRWRSSMHHVAWNMDIVLALFIPLFTGKGKLGGELDARGGKKRRRSFKKNDRRNVYSLEKRDRNALSRDTEGGRGFVRENCVIRNRCRAGIRKRGPRRSS